MELNKTAVGREGGRKEGERASECTTNASCLICPQTEESRRRVSRGKYFFPFKILDEQAHMELKHRIKIFVCVGGGGGYGGLCVSVCVCVNESQTM